MRNSFETAVLPGSIFPKADGRRAAAQTPLGGPL